MRAMLNKTVPGLCMRRGSSLQCEDIDTAFVYSYGKSVTGFVA